MSQEAIPTRKRRRWPYITGGILVLILFLILLIPTIASLGPVRAMVLSRINAKLHGKLQIKSWSLGWMSGFHASDIALQGKKGGEILSIKHLSTGLTLRQLIGGDYTLGNVKIDDLHFNLVMDQAGNTNLQQILKPSPPSSSSSANSPLPNVSGNIMLNNITGTITRVGAPTVAMALRGTVKIPSINQPIDNDLSVSLQSGSSAPGDIAIKGQIAAIAKNQVLDLAKMNIREDVSLKNIDLAVLSPFLPMEEIDTLSGRAHGEINIAKYPGRGIVANGELAGENVAASGPALRGDTYSTKGLLIRIPSVQITPEGMINFPEAVQAQFDQGRLKVAARTSVAALENLARKQAPGEKGFINADFEADFAALSRELPHTLDLRPGLALSSAQAALSAKVEMVADHATTTEHVELSHIAGRDGDQPIAFSPITLDAQAAILPSNTPVPTLHDLSIKLKSDFATADFHGASLAEFGGNAHADLAIAQRQLAQLFDFHHWQFQGQISAMLNSTGDLMHESAPLEIVSRIQAENLNIVGGVQPVHEQSAVVDFSGGILRDASDSVTGIDHLKLRLQTNENGQAVTAFMASGSVRMNPGRSGWRVLRELHLDVDLPDLPRTASLVEAMQTQRVRWTSGKASAKIDLAEADGGLGGRADVTASDLAFAQVAGTYRFDPVHLLVGGKLADEEVDVTALDGSLGALASVQLAQPVILKNSATPTAKGEIWVRADLAKVSALASAWNNSPYPQTLSGQLAMEQTFSTDGSRMAARGNGSISNLQVLADAQPQFQERLVKIVNDLTFDSAAESINFNSCSIAMESSHALDATLSGAIRHLSTTRDFDNVHLELAYDLKAVLAIITPMLPPADQQALSQYAISGVQKHLIAITGSFPVGQRLEKSIRRVQVNGSIGLDRLEGNGVTITDLSPDFMLRDGVITITGNGKTRAQLNGGVIDLVGVSYDLADPAERISAPPGLQLVQGTQLNAPMLGKFGSNLNPVLSNPTQAAGLLVVSLDQCSNLSIAQFSHPLAAGTSPGNLKLKFSVGNVQIANNMAGLIGAFSPRSVLNHQLVGNIDNAQLSIENGLIWSNLKLRIGENLMLGFHGYIDMRTQELQHFILDFPTPLVGDIFGLAHLNNVPTDIPIPITGTTSHYTLDLSGLNQLADAAKKEIAKGANKVGKAVGSGVNHAAKFFNGLFHHDDNDQQ